MNCFKSNGKFLLTGEYLVLKGATALALPLALGQSMEVEILGSNDGRIYWEALLKPAVNGLQSTDIVHSETPWFKVVLDKRDFSVVATDDKERAERLSDILSKAKRLNETLFDEPNDYKFCTYLDFDPHWGLGSSSTLINNIAEWANINPYLLLDETFKGSGYDIACAKAESPIFYQINESTGQRVNESRAANFNPSFKDNIYFIYQGHKQNSANEVKAFLDKKKNYDREIKSISEISRIIPDIQTLSDFNYFIKVHEEIMSSCLERKRIKKHFNDFEGEMKSLGAWGGDFFMAATEWDDDKVIEYFRNKGLDVIFKYNDIILNREIEINSNPLTPLTL